MLRYYGYRNSKKNLNWLGFLQITKIFKEHVKYDKSIRGHSISRERWLIQGDIGKCLPLDDSWHLRASCYCSLLRSNSSSCQLFLFALLCLWKEEGKKWACWGQDAVSTLSSRKNGGSGIVRMKIPMAILFKAAPPRMVIIQVWLFPLCLPSQLLVTWLL